jgi:ferredoxin
MKCATPVAMRHLIFGYKFVGVAKLHRVELVNRNTVLNVSETQTILDAAEQAGLRLPVGCRFGACITCAARLIQGEVEQSQAKCLTSKQIALGYVLLCIAYPRADCRFEVGAECQDALYVNPFKGSDRSQLKRYQTGS